MSKHIAAACAALAELATSWMHPYRRILTRALTSEKLAPVFASRAGDAKILFHAPSGRAIHDAWDLYKGEPETMRWIESLPPEDTLWDIGANIGVYALVAAKMRGMRVLAFEPGAASYAALVKNIELNGMGGKIDAYNLAFDETSRLDYLNMADTGAGHSMHAFGQTRSIEGEIRVSFRQAVMGFSIDDFCAFFKPPAPDHIKLDVDSIELKILRGASATLSRVKTILVEIDGENRAKTGDEIIAYLQAQGFSQGPSLALSDGARNRVFRRPS